MAKLALLIGISEYEPGLHPLPAAEKDVEAMQHVLQNPNMGGFAVSDVTVLKNADRQLMEEAIEQLFADRQKDDLVVLYFSGHGIKDDTGKLYLATRTTRKNPQGQLIRSSALSASLVQENMSRSRSKRQVVILDSCFSGAFAEGLAAKDDGTVNIREQLGGEGRAVLTSSSATEYSFDEKGSDLSIYTRYLIEGMTTGAADLDEDGTVSIDELHEYASTKVREVQPAMKPEIYAIREGFKIRLTKVPPGDPTQKYRHEVRRYMNRGEVSFVGRKTLDALRSRVGLSAADATAIEDEVLAASRQDFRDKLQQYERDFTEALQQDVTLSADDLTALRQNLQHILGLRNEDTSPLEDRVRSRIEADKQHRYQYEQALAEALRQESPLSPGTRQWLQQMQQQWQLPDEDIAPIESRIAAEIEAYRRRLQQYEQALTSSTQRKYTLSVAQRNELLEEQHNLGLRDEDIAPLEAQIHAEIQAYQYKLQQYEQVLTQAMQHEYPLGEELREEVRRFQSVLELGEEDVAHIEATVVRQKAPTDMPPTSSDQRGSHESRVPEMDLAADAGRERATVASMLQGKIETRHFDVFLCHKSEDKPAVKDIGNQLKDLGILPWLDEWELRPGLPWQRLLEEQIGQIKSVAVFIGRQGIGPWQQQELAAFLREFVNRGCPVIPVLLPNAPEEPQLPIFLRSYTWVDFRRQDPDPLERLIWGITGIRRTL